MKTLLFYHMIAFALSAALDIIIGDPKNLPHPIRLIGRLIAGLEKLLYDGTSRFLRFRGAVLCVTVILLTGTVTGLIAVVSYRIDFRLFIAAEGLLGFYTLAARSLCDESIKVYSSVADGDTKKARAAVSRIVGRDTDRLDDAGVIRAAVETVAENTSDGVIAPMFYLLLGGFVLAMIYKAINTMDSMIGYKNSRYEDFGRFAAKTDDVFNFLPARISALCMIIATTLLGKSYDTIRAAKVFLRDRYNHKSPNSAQTESVCAGALGVRLAGDAYYFGELVKKPYIGDDIRAIEALDIKRSVRLMYMSEAVFFSVCELLMLVLFLRL